MKPIELALKYMDIFYSGKDYDRLYALFADDLSFTGPLYSFDSAKAYIASVKNDPPANATYKIINQFETRNTACLIYEFTKPGVNTPMAQLFEIEKNKIMRILLIFDTHSFT